MQKVDFAWELIIADDYSTDGTREIILDYQKKKPKFIKLILQDKNVGPTQNWLDLIAAPKSKYITVFDGDDYWTDPDKLQKQVDFLEKNPQYVLCFHDSIIVDKMGNTLQEWRIDKKCKRNFTSNELYQIPPIDTLTNCFRNVITDFPEEINFCPGGDRFLIALLAEHGSGAYLDSIEPAVYRYHPGGISGGLDQINGVFNYIKTRFYISKYLERIGKTKEAEDILNDQVKGILSDHFSRLYRQIESLNTQLASVDAQLTSITSGRVWKLALWLRRIRLIIAPPGSVRSRLGERIFSRIKKIIK